MRYDVQIHTRHSPLSSQNVSRSGELKQQHQQQQQQQQQQPPPPCATGRG
jgi:hypothetical protein